MAVRKRQWKSGGKVQTRWAADWYDANGKRHVKLFEKKGDASKEEAKALAEREEGRAPEVTNGKKTFKAAADEWLNRTTPDPLEQSTIDQWEQHIRLHLNPIVGHLTLAKLTETRIEDLSQSLSGGLSAAMAVKVWATFRAILVAKAPAAVVASADKYRIKRSKRHKSKEVKAPEPEEVRLMLEIVPDRWRPLIVTLTFSGLRISEARGLRWKDLDFAAGTINVVQRADRYNKIGPPKSDSSRREIPMLPMVENTLRAWQSKCPKGELDLVFPNGSGKIEGLPNISRRGFRPLQVACGIVDEDGEPKYGLHALRHFFASWLLREGFDIKSVQKWLGHASATMTLDVYGSYMPEENYHERLAKSQKALVGSLGDKVVTRQKKTAEN